MGCDRAQAYRIFAWACLYWKETAVRAAPERGAAVPARLPLAPPGLRVRYFRYLEEAPAPRDICV